ncbi:hypothetical protein [Streptomyces sp. NPDC048428]|uniref:hypothetical protein n=1 Tax=Streptomyces sp. NPDC048428 TaxID=3154503 RepID=UPI003438576E
MSAAPELPGPGSTRLRIHLLGGLRVEREDGAPVTTRWRRSTAVTLVKLLALAPDRRQHREEVMHLLWPRAPGSRHCAIYG